MTGRRRYHQYCGVARALDVVDDTFRPSWLALSLRSRFRSERAIGVDLMVTIEVDGETLHARAHDGTLTTDARPGPSATTEEPDVTVVGDPAALLAAARGEPTGERLEVSGEPSAVAQFADVFGLPATAADPKAR